MFERYAEQARRALFFARYEATECAGSALGPEHLLMGLARSGNDLAERILRRAGLTLEAIKAELASGRMPGQGPPTSVEIPFTEPMKVALRSAAEEADALGHRDIDTVHLLLGILRTDESPAAALLIGRGIDLQTVRGEAGGGGSGRGRGRAPR
jgi:ATP-dependent Clp protease ATP-binding subunit ClpC